MADGATQESHINGNQKHVPKVKDSLQQSMHFCLKDEVVYTVQEHVHCCGGAAHECCPLPKIIFCIQAKVNDNDARHTDHNDENGVDAQQKAVNMIEFVIPQACQNA